MTNAPATARELYDLLLQAPNLCGRLTLESDHLLRWDLWEDYCLCIGLNATDVQVVLEKTGRFPRQITHWHTDNDEILEELRSIGTRDNLLVIRQGWLWEAVVHMGAESECPKRSLRRSLFSKPIILKAQ